LSYKLLINPIYKNFEKELINIQTIFKDSDNSIHKARNELKIIELQGLKCVVKSFKVPHFINRFAYTYMRGSKAKKSYINALKLIDLDVSTPTPIGVIEFFKDGLLEQSYFLSLYEPYDFTIREVFHHKISNHKEILKKFANFTYNIHQKGVWHIDYSLGNILITEDKNSYKFSLVDINRMKFMNIPAKEGLKNFNKFWAKDKNDLIIIAKEYARLASFDEKEAIKIVLNEAQSLENIVNLKRNLKGKR